MKKAEMKMKKDLPLHLKKIKYNNPQTQKQKTLPPPPKKKFAKDLNSHLVTCVYVLMIE